jgi:hypothetical protein
MLCQAHWIDKVIETFRKWQFQYLLNIIVKLVTINYRIRQKRLPISPQVVVKAGQLATVMNLK